MEQELVLKDPVTGGEKIYYNPSLNTAAISALMQSGASVLRGTLPSGISLPTAQPEILPVGQANFTDPNKIAVEREKLYQQQLDSLTRQRAQEVARIESERAISRAKQEDVNKRALAAVRQSQIRSGATQYAPDISTGVLSSEETAGIQRLQDLDAKYQSLISEANSAYDSKQFALVNKKLDELDNLQEEINKAYASQVAESLKAEKKAAEQAEKNKIISSIISEVKNGTASLDSVLLKYGEKISPADALAALKAYEEVDPAGYKSAIGKEYQDYVRSEKGAGRSPIGFNEYQNLDANRKAAIARASNSGLDFKAINVINKHQTEFNNSPIIKSFITIQEKLETVNQIINSGLGGPGDLAIVFEFMKGLDPDSVVRETEYANAAKSGNIFKGVFARFNGYLKEEGGFLPDNVKEAFAKIVQEKYNAKVKQYDNLKSEKARIINKQVGIEDGDQYLVDYKQALTINPSTFDATFEDPKTGERKSFKGLTQEEINQAISQGLKRIK